MMMSKTAHIIIAIIIVSSLINNDYFCNPSFTAYFFYAISTSAFLIFTGISLIKNKNQLTGINYTPLILFTLLSIFYLLQGLFAKGSINTMQVYIAANALLLIAFTLLIKNRSINLKVIYNIIIVAALIESFVCILQFSGLFKSQNEFLKVSGTWVNPNVTAMFLAMSFPAALAICITKRDNKPKFNIHYLPIIIISIALLLLKCRTAIVGSLVIIAIVLNSRYNFLQKIKSISLKKQFGYYSIFLLITIPLALFAYKAKQNSADGRKLIWKTSANMFMQNPITGIGYGNFEHDYNLQQAKYFEEGNGTAQEINNASFVNMAYNEFLQNAVEGGVIALGLFTAFLTILFISSKEQKKQSPPTAELAFSGVAAFTTMSILNFTVQAIPAMCLFLIYTSTICAKTTKINISMPTFLKPSISILLILAGSVIFSTQNSLAKSFAKTKKAITLSNNGDNLKAMKILMPLSTKMKNSETYWITYGKVLYNQKLYLQALEKFKIASILTSSPSLFMQVGNCYFKLQQFDSAISACTIAKNIAPNRIKPNYALMKIYERMNDTVNIIKTANEIIALQPKGKSKEAETYKAEANKILTSLNSK